MVNINRFKDKTVIVTGGASGLGEQISKSFAEHGANVVLASRNLENLKKVESEIIHQGYRAKAVQTDVSQKESVENMISEVHQQFGSVDILINNAAIYPSKPFEEVDVEEWDKVFSVNSRGYFLCAKAVLEDMKQKRYGRIINVSSITYFLGFEKLIHYVSTKGAAIGFTRALAREVGKYGITVNSLAPGAFPTAAEEIHPDLEAYNQHILDNQCIKRRGNPHDVANAVMFFADEASSFVTGQNLLVDGGWAMD